jgi:beta-glucosidase
MSKEGSIRISTEDTSVYLDPKIDIDRRVDDLVDRMTLEEKISQMVYHAPAIPRLKINEYNWWNECLHGVARAGIATVFPQSIGMAASFNTDLMFKVATVISDEARAKHHESARLGDRQIYKGLTYWTPNINIFRDPRWGRGQETYGEDPYLTGRMGVAFVKGLQGNHSKYLKLVATPKHYAVHSGPEALRHYFDASVSKKDLRETYLPAFKECVKEAQCASVMGAYNRVNGEPCCASKTLLQDILRDEWGFDGYVVSDCGAIQDIHQHHTVTSTPEQSAALAVNNGCDLNCGKVFLSLQVAIKKGLISEKTINQTLRRLFKARMRLGMFDPPEKVPYAQIPIDVVESKHHLELSLQMARESIVLLKNDGKLLPLKKNISSIAMIGPNADDRQVLLGNYNGFPSKYFTILDGIREKVSSQTKIVYAKGSALIGMGENYWGISAEEGFSEALSAADRAEVIVMCLGLTADFEGEEGSTAISEWMGDRINIGLPEIQQRLLEAICSRGKPVVLVLFSGSPLAIPWAHKNVPAILQAWYPGAQGGIAVADVLFGDYSPAGRLPITFVKSLDQLPPFTDYNMKGRTYRYMTEEPLYPFGYGLSYASFEYNNLKLSTSNVKAGDSLKVTVDLRNTGDRAGDEVVQLYLSALTTAITVPRSHLQGFMRIHLKPSEKKTVSFELKPRQMAIINEEGKCILETGSFQIAVGSRQPDRRSENLAGSKVLAADFNIVGETSEIEY